MVYKSFHEHEWKSLSTDTSGGTVILNIGSLATGRTESAVSGIFNNLKWYARTMGLSSQIMYIIIFHDWKCCLSAYSVILAKELQLLFLHRYEGFSKRRSRIFCLFFGLHWNRLPRGEFLGGLYHHTVKIWRHVCFSSYFSLVKVELPVAGAAKFEKCVVIYFLHAEGQPAIGIWSN